MTAPDMMDFSLPDEPIRFRIAPDEFEAPPVIPAKTLRRFASLATALGQSGDDMDAVIDNLANAFRALMPGEHGERFAARLLSDGAPGSPPPLDLQRQVMRAMVYLLERYGLRPTQPSSASSDGSQDGLASILSDGTDSTDGASPTETVTT